MNFKGNFKYLSNANITGLTHMVNHLTDKHWLLSADRQKRYEVHKDTQTINLVFDDDFRHTQPSKHPALDVFAPIIEPILTEIAHHYEIKACYKTLLQRYGQGYFIRINLVKLTAGGVIDSHQDKNFSLAHSHRIHIPIQTNDAVLFTVGDEVINMKVGEVIEINNRQYHHVENKSDKDRVHMILDFVIPGEACCCAKVHHPEIECNPNVCMPTDRLHTDCHCFD